MQRWELIAAAVFAFFIAWRGAIWVATYFSDRIYMPRGLDVDERAKIIRQDFGAVIALLSIVNGLLGAIVAVLIAR
jgi:hypothetical protein